MPLLYKIKKRTTIPVDVDNLEPNQSAEPRVFEETTYVGNLDLFLSQNIDLYKIPIRHIRLTLLRNASKIKITTMQTRNGVATIVCEFCIQAVHQYATGRHIDYQCLYTAKSIADVYVLLGNSTQFKEYCERCKTLRTQAVSVMDLCAVKRFD